MGIFDQLMDLGREAKLEVDTKLDNLKLEMELKVNNFKYDFDDIKFKIEMEVDELKDDIKETIHLIRTSENKNLHKGCVLRERRKLYDHYGIYAGNGEVIHLTEGKIQKTPLSSFSDEYIEIMGFSSEYSQKKTLAESFKRAQSKIGKSGYNFINNNCEQFALWCRIGESVSTQAFNKKSPNYNDLGVTALPHFISKVASMKYGMKVSRRLITYDIYDYPKIEES